ncbi:hypothetical protein K2173_004837 [Erythroxylum novogranatense]|uniref:DUF4371 domain-containing protein n=1 Tax=Erythroxylum novogranatense TaxID=1862640 RepID=A0AAV8TCC5_9ROSI|nr:hypothetical protein K2173_004837 [Erythroxylum novogranatense]
MNQSQSIQSAFSRQSEKSKIEYRCRLNASIGRLQIRNVVLGNAPENLKLTSPNIQRDIINAAAFETTKAIILDIGDDLFSILVDECRDVSSLFSNYGLSIASLRGQGYDGASNMRGEFHELNNRFDEVNTSLLLCMACLDPKDSFSAFDMDKLIELAKFYPSEFHPIALIELEY